MKKVVVLGSLPPPYIGQNVLTRLNAQLLSESFDVQIIDTSTGLASSNDSQSALARVAHYGRARRQISNALREAPEAPVVWHTVSPQPAGHLRDVLTVLPAIPEKNPVVAVVHWGSFDTLFRHPWLRASSQRLVRRVQRFIFLDGVLASRCSEWIPDEKVGIVPNTIEADLIPSQSSVDERVNLGPGRRSELLFVSNMIPSKGYLEFLRALPVLDDAGLHYQATFVGKWQNEEDERRFFEVADALGVSDRVQHLRQVTDRATLGRCYLDADVFVLPTYYPTEAQPLCVIEALAAATPVVLSRHASLPSMVHDGVEARFVETTHPDAIAAGILQLLDASAWQKSARAARATFDEKFSPSQVLSRWADLLGNF